MLKLAWIINCNLNLFSMHLKTYNTILAKNIFLLGAKYEVENFSC